ncbi:hypothetical protein DUI87_05597 [Hirundo rustica rustica]|uniref:Uncharacterized protein n=1 Tax=Hirundo rustica rustica TaxID=333673 RepID=A0A3M0KXG8_HIRRU|nr:hypothetical protein DUI87_05597 [Hirundo rustica rustica]
MLVGQVTVVTPLGENCSSSTVLSPPAVRISELCLASGSAHIRCVELEGKPGTSLRGLSLVFFSGKEGKLEGKGWTHLYSGSVKAGSSSSSSQLSIIQCQELGPSVGLRASFQGWEIALFVMGSLLLLLLFVGLAFYFIKRRPSNDTNIKMNDGRQMAADF